MFEEMVISIPNPKKTNKPWTVVVSMVFQVVFLGMLILIPLIYTEALPKTMMATMLTAPPPPPPPPPPPAPAQVVHVKPQAHLMDARSEEHTSELQSRLHLVCRLLLEN